MMATARALTDWFSQFGIGVYLDGDVPDDAQAPYMTIPLKEPEWSRPTAYQFNVWYRTTSNVEPLSKADEIIAAVGVGVRIPCDGGVLVLWPDNPLVYAMTDEDYRGAHINLVLNAYKMPGV